MSSRWGSGGKLPYSYDGPHAAHMQQQQHPQQQQHRDPEMGFYSRPPVHERMAAAANGGAPPIVPRVSKQQMAYKPVQVSNASYRF
jgi:hypothetical protein